MTITREAHLTYITKITPLLILGYILQSYLYLKIGPQELAQDVIAFVGGALILTILVFWLHDTHQKIRLHKNFVEITFPLLNYHEEFLIRDIQSIEVKQRVNSFGDLILTLKDDRQIKLNHIDQPFAVKNFLMSRQG
jgi:hypothetical protein